MSVNSLQSSAWAAASLVLALATACSSPTGGTGGVGADASNDAGGSDPDVTVDAAGGGDAGNDAVSSDADSAVEDAAADVATADAVVDDAAGADTGGADTGGADTGGADTGGADTGGADTGGVDTGGGDAVANDASGDTGGGGSMSCAGRCGKYDSKAACQCDSICEGEGDCCPDYKQLCTCKVDADCAVSGDKCSVSVCVAGACDSTTKQCDDANDCSIDSCEAATGNCVHKPEPEGDACADGSCKKGTCAAGKCANVKPVDDGGFCSDSDQCTSADKCASGACVGTKKVCDDKSVCTLDSCDKQKGCVYTPEPDGKACDDGTLCSSKEACLKGSCQGTVVKCDDNDPCTVEACDPATGTCKGGPKCGDGDPCTADNCTKDGTFASCKYVPSLEGAACEDGDPCTGGETCGKGMCQAVTSICETPVFADAFACDKNEGWTIVGEKTAGKPGWAVDDKPTQPGAHLAPCSLNFNNDADYGGGEQVKGTATSKLIAVPAGKPSFLTLWSYHGVETSNSYDKRFVEISTDDFATAPAVSIQLDNSAKPKIWSPVAVPLAAYAGGKIKVRFRFDSMDGVSNTGVGWFIDEVSVAQTK